MAQQYNEGDIADGPGGQTLVFRGGRWVPQGGAIGGPIVLGTPSATKAPMAAAELLKAQAAAQAAIAGSPYAPRQASADITKSEADARKAAAEAKIAETTAAQGGQGKNLSAEVREKALKQYNAGQLLNQNIADIEAHYKTGPGATTGLAGLRDYLPTTANQQFDAAGNSARGNVGSALGFTGGQLNTEREAEKAVGPFLPQASDRDAVILDKIARLKQIRDNAMNTAIQTLGGIPDVQGNITPVSKERGVVGAVPGAVGGSTGGMGGGGPSAPSGPTLALATGSTRTELNKAASSALEQAIRSGASVDSIKRDFPNVDAGQITAVRQYLVKHPDYTGFAQVTNEVPNSAFSRVAASPFGTAAISAGDAVLPLGVFGQDVRDKVQASKDANPAAALAGTIIGGVPAAAGLELGAARLLPGLGSAVPRLADAAYGAIQGAGNADDGNGAIGALEGAGAGLLGGELGRRGVAAAGSALRGVTDPAVSYLRKRNIPVTVAQALGGTAKMVEDQSTGFPLIGGIIRNRRAEGIDAFNREAFDQAAAPLARQTAPLTATTADVGPQGIEQLRVLRNAGYDNAVSGRSAVADPTFDQAYNSSLTGIGAIPNTGSTVQGEVQAIVPDYFSGQGATGTITGENAQAAIKELKGVRSAREGDALGYRTGQGVRSVENAITGLFDRQAPGFSTDLAAANSTNGNLKTLESAVTAAKNTDGVFRPAQLNTASVASGRNFGGTAATTQRPFYDLANYGQDVLPSKEGDSGTAGRLALGAGLGVFGLGGGAVGASTSEDGSRLVGGGEGSVGGLATLAGLAALGGSRPAQRLLVSALADRPDSLVRIGDQIYNRAALGGALGVLPTTALQQKVLAP